MDPPPPPLSESRVVDPHFEIYGSAQWRRQKFSIGGGDRSRDGGAETQRAEAIAAKYLGGGGLDQLLGRLKPALAPPLDPPLLIFGMD